MYLLFNPKLLPNDPQDYDILLVEVSMCQEDIYCKLTLIVYLCWTILNIIAFKYYLYASVN